jgi:ubiquinone/menaquinone biosynthesis C-methylase UbiE
MVPEIKFDLSGLLSSGEKVSLELGCGLNKKNGRIGIDQLNLEGVDIVGDVVDCLKLFPDASVDEIFSNSLLEHVDDLEQVVRETARVLKKTGKHFAFVPHFSNPYYYSDYTHQKFIGLYTFYYFVEQKNQLARKVPVFYSNTRIKILSQKLIFASPFKGRRIIKKLFQYIFNSSTWMQEFYEENLCYIIPCYAIEIVYAPD